ncbi:MAG TPA: hypothetical protein VKD72_30255, partial [Gemmataceae bacterium]|nr:hypothetical protein [Gemmataceae bacterium]
MSIRMSCPSCEEEVVVNDSQAGKKIRCKECGEVFAVKKGTSSRGGGISNSLANGGSKAAGGPLRGFPREEDEEEDRPRSRRRKSASPATMWIVIGSCGGGAFLLTIILVIVLNSGSDKPADDSGPVVEINDPRGRVRVKIPDNVPKDFAKDFAKDFEKPKVEDADPITRAINDLGGNVFSQGDAARNLERMSVNEARRAEVVAALKKVIDTREALIPRAECVKALAVWGTRADSTYLMNLLDDQDGAVKNSAMRALGKLKEDRAASILAGRLSDFFQRGEASQALKDIGPGAEAAVRQQLQNQDGG